MGMKGAPGSPPSQGVGSFGLTRSCDFGEEQIRVMGSLYCSRDDELMEIINRY